jgi:tRNA pseudouridine13 synthase
MGIVEYIGKHDGFSAIIKQRFTDFHVNEIDLDGQVAKLVHQDIPSVQDDDENVDDLKASVSATVWEQLQVLNEKTFAHIDIDVTNLDKTERRSIHVIAKKLANVISQTVDKDDKKIITIVTNSKACESGESYISHLCHYIFFNVFLLR